MKVLQVIFGQDVMFASRMSKQFTADEHLHLTWCTGYLLMEEVKQGEIISAKVIFPANINSMLIAPGSHKK